MEAGATTVVGRGRELERLDAALAELDRGGGALVVRGEPGIGKSALLQAVAVRAAANGLTVLRTVGVRSEARLPFAGLHQLLRPVLDRTAALPAAQRDALHAAFGLGDGDASDLFRVALGTLELLSDTAVRSGVLVLADDLQWLDAPTCEVLAFVARRLESDAILLLAAIRDGSPSAIDTAGLPELRLERLDGAAAAGLLEATSPGLPPPLRERLLDEAAGNPLALLELPIALRALRDGTVLPDWLPLTTRLERTFAARTTELPARTRTLLLAAALNDGDALAEALAAASTVAGEAVSADDAAPAVSAALLDVDGAAVRFRHPLVRSAIHQAAPLGERQRTHAALAQALATQPERRVWHRAAAIVGPDGDLAAELERTAGHAQRRGGTSVAVIALERAAQLTADTALRGTRLVRAAELAFELGRRDVVLRLLEEAERLELDPLERGRVLWLRELFDEGLWAGAPKIAASVELARRMQAAGDAGRAADSLITSALTCWWCNLDADSRGLVVAAAEALPIPADDPKLLATLAFAAPLERGAVVLRRLAGIAPDPAANAEEMRLLSTAAVALGAFDQAAGFVSAAITGLRAQGRLGLLARALVGQGWASIHLGTWDLGLAATGEAERLAEETAQSRWAASAKVVQAIVTGLRGEEQQAELLVGEAERMPGPRGANPLPSLVELARGVTAMTAGRHDHAYAHLHRVFDPGDLAFHTILRGWFLFDFVDVAVQTGHRPEAERALDELEEAARRTGSPLLRIGVVCARPLVAEGEHADALFTAALEADFATWRYLHARLRLARGIWLRRQRRAAESRAPLRAAREGFDALGALPWGARARQELRASGEASRNRLPYVRDDLTPQELQIAEMAATGLTNRDIGQRLFLSHRTVASHLYRIFPKLGVTSRSELATALAHDPR